MAFQIPSCQEFGTARTSHAILNQGWDHFECAAFGSILAATDPVAVVGLLKDQGGRVNPPNLDGSIPRTHSLHVGGPGRPMIDGPADHPAGPCSPERIHGPTSQHGTGLRITPNRWFFTAQEGASGHKEGQAAQAVLLPGLWSPQPCQEMGASRVLTMQIAGESLLNAPRHGHVCVKQKDPFPKSSWPLRTGRRSSCGWCSTT